MLIVDAAASRKGETCLAYHHPSKKRSEPILLSELPQRRSDQLKGVGDDFFFSFYLLFFLIGCCAPLSCSEICDFLQRLIFSFSFHFVSIIICFKYLWMSLPRNQDNLPTGEWSCFYIFFWFKTELTRFFKLGSMKLSLLLLRVMRLAGHQRLLLGVPRSLVVQSNPKCRSHTTQLNLLDHHRRKRIPIASLVPKIASFSFGQIMFTTVHQTHPYLRAKLCPNSSEIYGEIYRPRSNSSGIVKLLR